MDQYVLIMRLWDYELSGLAVVGCGVFVLVLWLRFVLGVYDVVLFALDVDTVCHYTAV